MRDPGVDARVDAALEETRHVLGLLSRLGGLAPGREVDPDHEIRFEAQIWLTLEAPMGRPPPEHVRLISPAWWLTLTQMRMVRCGAYPNDPRHLNGKAAAPTRCAISLSWT